MTPDPGRPPTSITVRGNASAEELAALLTVLAAGGRAGHWPPRPDAYRAWRGGRRRAVRRTPFPAGS